MRERRSVHALGAKNRRNEKSIGCLEGKNATITKKEQRRRGGKKAKGVKSLRDKM